GPLPQAVRARDGAEDQGLHAGGGEEDGDVPLAGERPRAAQRGRAGGGAGDGADAGRLGHLAVVGGGGRGRAAGGSRGGLRGGCEALWVKEIEKRHILRTLEHTEWNKSKAAAILQIERSTLDRKIRDYDLKR